MYIFLPKSHYHILYAKSNHNTIFCHQNTFNVLEISQGIKIKKERLSSGIQRKTEYTLRENFVSVILIY